MLTKKLKRKIAIALSAGVIAVTSSYAAVPAPQTEAFSWGNVIGAVIGGAVTSAQLNQEIKTYNNTEEGSQAYFQAMKNQLGVNEDVELNAQLDTIMGNLTEAIGSVDPTIYDKPYNYFINKDTSFNAFCTIGHNMSVNTGLFGLINNEDEIAVVLGHEMGHGQKDHPAKGAKQSIGPQILANATGNIAGVLVANLWNNQGITKPMEWEADNLAFEYITHSNYNPGATAAIWQRVMDRSTGGGNEFLQFLAGGPDHPSDKQRRNNYLKKLKEYSNGHVEMDEGLIKVNGKDFATPAASNGMSAKERACFVLGNLAAAYHNGHDKGNVTVNGNVVMMGAQAIMESVEGDESAQVLADRLASIK